MVGLIAIVGGFVFGAADQYLGSLVMLGPWAISVSLMSAPWLALPFAAGCTQRAARRAAWLGLIVTAAALAGYFEMTLSPIEGVPLSRFPGDLVGLARSELPVLLGAPFSGPLFGWLGHRWRSRRWWPGAALLVGALCLEPLARVTSDRLSPPSAAWTCEVAAGVLLAALFAAQAVRATKLE